MCFVVRVFSVVLSNCFSCMCAFILIDDYIIISIFHVCAIMDYQFYDLISVNVRVCNCFIYIITKLHILF